MIKQFGGTGYEHSDVVVIDEVEMQRHQQLEKLYRATRASKVKMVLAPLFRHSIFGDCEWLNSLLPFLGDGWGVWSLRWSSQWLRLTVVD